MGRSQLFRAKSRWPITLIAMVALIVVVGLTGGSARADISSLLILRPISIGFLTYAVLTADRETMRNVRGWIILFGCVGGLVLLQLLPLPPSLWRGLPGREILVEIDSVVGLGDPWRPISLNPQMTRNALWSLAVPLAALIMAVRLDRAGHRTLLDVVLLTTIVSGVLGVFQFAGGPDGPLYLYRISNFGSAVGLFANRNHAGVFLACQFPLLAAMAISSQSRINRQRWRGPFAIAMAAALVPMILITGSRAGLITALIGIGGAAMIIRPLWPRPTSSKNRRRTGAYRPWMAGLAGFAFVAFCAVFIGLNAGNSLDRLLGNDGDIELRWPMWGVSMKALGAFFPVGSGFGAFPQVFQLFEPDSMLRPSYANHAHNDYLEVVLDGGFLGAVLIVAAFMLVARDCWWVRRNGGEDGAIRLGQAAAVALAQIALASAFDYPLRTPLMAAFVMLLIVWLRLGALRAREVSAIPSGAERSLK